MKVVSVVAVILAWVVIAGVLSAYVRWCFTFSVTPSGMWREVARRAVIAPLLYVGLIASQWVLNRVEATWHRESFLFGFIVAWLIPPMITLVRQVVSGRGAVSGEVAPPVSTSFRPSLSGSLLIAIVAGAVIPLGAWLLLLATTPRPDWLGAGAILVPIALLVTLFLLTRRLERSTTDQAMRSHQVGLLWAIGIALMAMQCAIVAKAMNILTLFVVFGAAGMLIPAAAWLALLLRYGRHRQ